jgi:predicted O-methyltransferase YrrM
MYRFYKKFQPKSVFECGLGPGGSALAYLLTNPLGKLVSVDVEPRSDSVQTVNNLLGYPVDWVWIWDESQSVLRRTKSKFELLYVDGDHRTHGVYHDALYGDSILEKGGIVLFDDAGNVWKENICRAIEMWLIDCPWYEEFVVDLGIVNPDGPRMFRKLK